MTNQLPTQPAAPLYGPAAPTNVLAIVSLITSILGISLAGIITGHLALGQIRRTGEQGRGMAIAGLVIGYAYVALTVIFFVIWLVFAAGSLLFFGIAGVTEHAHTGFGPGY